MNNDPEYEDLLARALAAYEALTPEQKKEHDRAQRISFVYGNLRLDGIEVTEEQVAAVVDRVAESSAAAERVSR